MYALTLASVLFLLCLRLSRSPVYHATAAVPALSCKCYICGVCTGGHHARQLAIIDPKSNFFIARVYGCACLTSWAAASAWSRAVSAHSRDGGDPAALLQAVQVLQARQQACRLVVACMACVCWKRQHSRTLSDDLVPDPGQQEVGSNCMIKFGFWLQPHIGHGYQWY